MAKRSEFELLARVRRKLPPVGGRVSLGVGDDAAITVPGGATATSVDAIVDGVHFERRWIEPEQIGRKAIGAALSDLAAMGAEAGEAYVVLGVPGDFGEDDSLALLDGAAAAAADAGAVLAGGDVTRSAVLFASITAVGHAASPDRLVRRAGAGAGETVVLTGELGAAAAGLLLLERPELASAVSEETARTLRGRQLEPRPRLAAGRALARAGATAMIDVSDGLGGDAVHLAEESGVSIAIESGALPLANGVAEVAAAAGLDPMTLAVCGGEDYELLATLPGERLGEAATAVGEAGATLAAVGEVLAGEPVAEVRLPDGRLLETSGYDQLG